MNMKKGDNLTLSWIKSTVHLGAHTDAPSHYHPMGAPIHRRPLQAYLGPVQIIEVPTRMGQRVGLNDLKQDVKAPRVLFKTRSFPDPYNWNNDFMGLSTELLEHLQTKGVVLVGLDTPSVDLAEDKVLIAHNVIYKYDMSILEGVILEHVEPGFYDLICLPLNIEGADATPVRAVLLK